MIVSVGVVSVGQVVRRLEPELSANVVITGTDGSVWSMMIANGADAALVLSAASVAVAVKL